MKKFIAVVALVAICFLAVGCATITSPVVATTNPVGSKVGQASGKIWFGAFGTADAGIQAAAKNGGITNISTVDLTTKLGILGLWVEYEATVTGE
jgi:FlaG/FlaF family flagellin (archaellin)